MPRNTFFQFRQFRVEQARCAMKVSADACLFGAVVAREVRHLGPQARLLDVGAGTGLLALMLAQACEAQILGVEIEPAAAAQAAENVAASPWASRVEVRCQAVQALAVPAFDVVVSNPPFFNNSLKAADTARTLARHTDSLSFAHLLHSTARLLKPEGRAYVLLPPPEADLLARLAPQHGLCLRQSTALAHSPAHRPHRLVLQLQAAPGPVAQHRIDVYQAPKGPYTAAFTELLKPYYLFLDSE